MSQLIICIQIYHISNVLRGRLLDWSIFIVIEEC